MTFVNTYLPSSTCTLSGIDSRKGSLSVKKQVNMVGARLHGWIRCEANMTVFGVIVHSCSRLEAQCL